jgi:hypothetical protein
MAQSISPQSPGCQDSGASLTQARPQESGCRISKTGMKRKEIWRYSVHLYHLALVSSTFSARSSSQATSSKTSQTTSERTSEPRPAQLPNSMGAIRVCAWRPLCV